MCIRDSSNTLEWGPFARSFMREQAKQYDIIGFTETHQRGHRLQEARSDSGRDGWELTATEATMTGRSSEGFSGGEWIITQKRMATTSFEHLR
eukprot:1194849-Pyramimonas_sp.AAC.1